MNYKVVCVKERYISDCIREMERQVSALIEEGWIPKGGASLTCVDRTSMMEFILTQAMIKNN